MQILRYFKLKYLLLLFLAHWFFRYVRMDVIHDIICGMYLLASSIMSPPKRLMICCQSCHGSDSIPNPERQPKILIIPMRYAIRIRAPMHTIVNVVEQAKNIKK